LAVGASKVDVLGLLLKRGLTVVGFAILVGLAISIGFGKAASSLLYGLNPADPLRLGAVALLMLIAMLAGILLPARAAINIDPAISLREQ
jgi:ABC-type antimicrobial peptide transport system permease subunit